MPAEGLAAVDVRDVHLDDRGVDDGDRVPDGDGRMRVGSGVDDDPGHALAQLVDGIDDLPLVVALAEVKLEASLLSRLQAQPTHVVEGFRSVDLGLPFAEEVEVRPLENGHDGGVRRHVRCSFCWCWWEIFRIGPDRWSRARQAWWERRSRRAARRSRRVWSTNQGHQQVDRRAAGLVGAVAQRGQGRITQVGTEDVVEAHDAERRRARTRPASASRHTAPMASRSLWAMTAVGPSAEPLHPRRTRPRSTDGIGPDASRGHPASTSRPRTMPAHR